MTEKQIVDQVKRRLVDLGYPLSSIQANVRTGYGRSVDLVVFEAEKPWIVFELKASPHLVLPIKPEDVGFHSTVRQAQSLAQEIGAPYFAVSDGNTISWFSTDTEDGRPQLLQAPITSFARRQERYLAEDSKEAILHVLFSLADIGRRFFDLRESIPHVGMAVLARLMSEAGDKTLEDLLLDSSSPAQLLDDALAELVATQDERTMDFYSEAFLILDNLTLSGISQDHFIGALDQLIELLVDRGAMWPFKLPAWLSELMAHLAQPKSRDVILDIYSNFGDGVVAVSKTNRRSQVLSIASSASSYLWDRLKRQLLGFDSEDVTRVNALDEYVCQQQRFEGQPDQVLLAPPYGVRLKEGEVSGKSEEFLLRLAVDWVRPGGRVIAMMPENLLFSTRQSGIRQYVMQNTWLRAVISLEQFTPGTSIKASILVLDRRSSENDPGKVMMCRIQGEDVRDSLNLNTSILTNRRLGEILDIYDSHMQDESAFGDKGVWFVHWDDLDIKSLAVGYYEPERVLEATSQYPIFELRKLAELRKGSPLTLDPLGQLFMIGPGAIRTLSIDPTALDRTSRDRLPNRPVRAQRNDILIHAVGPNRGQAALVEEDVDNLFVSRNVIIVHPVSPMVLPAFLAIALNGSFVKAQLEERTTGSVIRQLGIRKIEDLRIPVPDLETQKSIIQEMSNARRKLLEIEAQALVVQATLREQQRNLQSILDSFHQGGGQDA